MIYLARHGETEWNREGRMQGRIGGTLTETGRRQAAVLGRLARQLGVERIVSSSLGRAVQTATIVATEVGIAFEAREELAELDCGACSGLSRTEIEHRFPGLLAERRLDPWRHRWPMGESLEDAALRARTILGDLLASGERTNTLVIAHQGVNRSLVHLLGEVPVQQVTEVKHPWEVLVRLHQATVAHRWFSEGESAEWIAGPCTAASVELRRGRVPG